MWASFNTQFGDAVRQQTNALSRSPAPAPAVDAEQLESLLQTAGTSGVRGFVFQSSSSLSETDPATRNRAAELELLNRRLQLMEPWLAGGKVVCHVASTDGRYDGIVLYVDRARSAGAVCRAAAEATNRGGSKPAGGEGNHVSGARSFRIEPGVFRHAGVHAFALDLDAASGRRHATGIAARDGRARLSSPKIRKWFRACGSESRGSQLKRCGWSETLSVARAQSIFEIDRRLTQLGMKPNLERRRRCRHEHAARSIGFADEFRPTGAGAATDRQVFQRIRGG